MNNHIYHDNFKSWSDVAREFDISNHYKNEPMYAYAIYNVDDYSGCAFVVFKKYNKWYSVSASHCSCYGLEDQFNPEEFSPELYFKGKNKDRDLIGSYLVFTHKKDFMKWLKEKSDV